MGLPAAIRKNELGAGPPSAQTEITVECWGAALLLREAVCTLPVKSPCSLGPAFIPLSATGLRMFCKGLTSPLRCKTLQISVAFSYNAHSSCVLPKAVSVSLSCPAVAGGCSNSMVPHLAPQQPCLTACCCRH